MGKTGGLFFRYLVFSVLLVAVPLGFLGFFFSGSYSRSVAEEALVQQNLRLLRFRDSGDFVFSQLHTILLSISRNENVLTPGGPSSPVVRRRIIRDLQLYVSTHAYIRDIVIAFSDDDLLYTAQGTLNRDTMVRYFYHFSNPNPLTRFLDGASPEKTLFRVDDVKTASGPLNALIMTVPLPEEFSLNKIGFVAVLVSESALKKALLGTQLFSEEELVIRENRGDALLASFGEVQSKEASSMDIESMDGSRRYTSTVSQSRMAEKFNRIRNSFLTILFTVVVVGALLVYGFMTMNYLPLSQLLRHISDTAGTPPPRLRELAFIQNAYDAVYEDSSRLRNEYANQLPAIRHYLAFRLLQGDFETAEQFKRTSTAAGLLFDRDLYRVIALRCKDIARSAPVLDHIIRRLAADSDCLGPVPMRDETVVLILNHSAQSDAGLYGRLSALVSEVKAQWSQIVTVGVGSAYRDFGKIVTSYVEASYSLDYRVVRGNGTVLAYDELEECRSRELSIPWEDLQNLRRAIIQRHQGDFAEQMKALILSVKETYGNLAEARVVFISLLETLISALYELRGTTRGNSLNLDIFALTRVETFDELIELMEDIEQKTHEVLEGETLLTDFGKRVLEWVDANFDDPNFSVQGVADEMEVSHTALNDRFKKEMGMTVADYYVQLRLKKAKVLLRTTRLPLKEIVALVGYQDATSFIKKFRAEERMTPGEYRRNQGVS